MQLIISGPWGTLASAFFLLSGVFGGDLLVLRGCLLAAYIFLLINGITGLPGWPWAAAADRVSVDMICWAIAAGVLHGCAVVRMLLDELPVRYKSEDDRQLATFFSRRSGMEPLEAKHALKHGKWMRVPAGQRVVSSVQLYECVYLLVEGRCSYASPCCPSSPGTPVNMSRATTRSLSPKPSPQQPLPSPAPQLSQQQQDHPQEQHHEEQQEEQAGLTLTRSVSLDDCFIRQDYVAIDLQPLQPIQSGIVADVSTGAAGRRGGALPAASPFAGAGAGAAVGVPLVKLTSSRVKMLFRSGNIFSLSALNVFGVYIGFDQFHGSQLEVWAETDCLLYSWPMSSLEKMATSCSPSLAAYWRNFITYSIASEFELRAHKRMTLCRCSTGELEHEGWLKGARSRDFTDPPREYERTGLTWERCSRWLRKTLSPFPPAGIRHTALPLTGVMARTRVMAVAEAKAQAARSRDVSVKLGLPPV